MENKNLERRGTWIKSYHVFYKKVRFEYHFGVLYVKAFDLKRNKYFRGYINLFGKTWSWKIK